ncbi:protein arginine N-methyltransferase [Pavlovales sp. CCMP2436]|nr:protein arginine N-methyltransferase [Pavlovales sp. CCMP2436]
MGDASAAGVDGQPEKFEDTTEYANYFVTYGYLYHQKQMLEDHLRMVSYRDAMLKNRAQFAGKVVLDVGAGSGVLSIWAAQAGAKKVYAVEATDAAKFARMVVEHNGLAGVVEVIQKKVEDIELPEKVDIIVSEWMGYMLLRESMLDSVIIARDRWLKPGGALYPSKATVYLAPIRTPLLVERSTQLTSALNEWGSFAQYMKDEHGIAVDCLNKAYEEEHKGYFLKTAQWKSLSADSVVGEACAWYSFDCATVTIEELKTKASGPFLCAVNTSGPVHALAGWFDVEFNGSADSPTETPVTLSTAPHLGYTHWGQQVFLLSGQMFADRGDAVQGQGALARQPHNPRTLFFDVTYTLRRARPDAAEEHKRTIRYTID